MPTARQKILTYFQKVRQATAQDLARGLKMSAATVRHHLRVLKVDGRLQLTTAQKGDGRGRPLKVYSLPASALGDNLPALSEALFAEAGSSLQVEALARRLASGADFRDQPAARRLNATVERLGAMNYHARWEASAGGPRLILAHCPYAAILKNHPELCKMDRALLQELLGQSAEQLTRVGREGSSVCIFAIR